MSITNSNKQSTKQLRLSYTRWPELERKYLIHKTSSLRNQGTVKVTLYFFEQIPYGNWDGCYDLGHVNLQHLVEES